MKIAFILSNGVYSRSSGVVSQALGWKKSIEAIGGKVTLINMWEANEWKDFDIIHFFGFSIYMRDLINTLEKVNRNIVVSPILDPGYSTYRLMLYARWGASKLGLTNQYHELYRIRSRIRLFLCRSEFEASYMRSGFRVPRQFCRLVPLAFDGPSVSQSTIKEPVCLHISYLAEARKNVERLVQASNKYNFPLLLAGRLRNEHEENLLRSWLKGSENTKYLGYLSEDEKNQLYRSSRVFALPSLNEGVGLVGLEAAALGCDIVLTNLGGPKEYYGGHAELVDPYDIDSIGNAVSKLLRGRTHQPALAEHVRSNFSASSVGKCLLRTYELIL